MALFTTSREFSKYPDGPSEQIFTPLADLDKLDPLAPPVRRLVNIGTGYLGARWEEILTGTGIKKKKAKGVPDITPPGGGTRYVSRPVSYPTNIDDLSYQLARKDAEADGYRVVEVDQGELHRLAGPQYRNRLLAGYEDGRRVFVYRDLSPDEKVRTTVHERVATGLRYMFGVDHDQVEEQAINAEEPWLQYYRGLASNLMSELEAA